MYDAIDIARYILSKCTKDEKPLSNLKLLKILYFIERDSLQKYNIDFFDENFHAWKFGPVIEKVYYTYRIHGASDIYEFDDIPFPGNDEHKKIVDEIVEEKREKYHWDLVKETHQDGGAWALTPEKGIMSKKQIKKYG